MFFFCKEKSVRKEVKSVSMNVVVYNDFWITVEGKRLQYKNNPLLVIDLCTFLWMHKIGFRAGILQCDSEQGYW